MEDESYDQKNIWKHIKQEVQLLDQTDSTIFGKEVCDLLVEVMICLDEVLMSEDVHSYIVRTCPSLSIDDSMVYIYNKVRASRQSNNAREFDDWCKKYGARQPDDDDDDGEGEDESDDE
jgi:hypothetical protein